MGDILDIWNTISNKAIAIDIISIFILGTFYCRFENVRKFVNHPRRRSRLLFVVFLALLNINVYLFPITGFKASHIYYFIIELFVIIYTIISIYKPILTFFPFKKLKKLVRGGYTEKCDSYFHFLKFLTLTTASRLEYKRLITDYYAKKHMFMEAYNEFYYLKQKRLFNSEINEIESYMAYYAALLGNIKLAKTHILRVKKKTPLSLLVEMKICDVRGGMIEEIIKYIEKAEEIITSQTPDGLKAQIYSIYSNCRMIQGNYEDALFNVKKALEFAKKSKNNIIIYNTYEQLIQLMLLKKTNKDDVDICCQEYIKQLNLNEPSTAIRAYNFMSRYYRLQNMEEKLLPLVANNYTLMIKNLDGCERYNWEISNLDVAQNAKIHINNIMNDVIRDFPNYKDVSMPNRFHLIKKLYDVLDSFFVNDANNVDYIEYQEILEECECYLAERAYEDLKQYYDTLNLNQIYERCETLHSMVAVSAMREWHNKICIIRYDKLIGNAYYYGNQDIITEHNERMDILKDIADIYSTNGLYPQSIDSYINIVDECYSVYWLEDDSKFEMNIIDKSNMEKYLDVTIKELQKSNNFKRFQPQYIKVAAQLCVLKRLDEAFFFYRLFDKRELKNLNLHTRSYFQFVDTILESYYY